MHATAVLVYIVVVAAHERQAEMAEVREIYPGVTVDTELMHGTPVLTGTRVPVSVVLGHLAAGDSIETVMQEYALTAEHLRAAFGYASQIIGAEQVYPVAAS